LSEVNYDLTICTVSTDETEHINLNYALTKFLNKENKPRWIIVENEMHNSNRLKSNRENFTVLKGLDENLKKELRVPNLEHGIALNRSLHNIKTRFVLVIDPDYFIIYPNWIEKILSYIQENNISIMGVPWHPKWNMKYRYFPCNHCMFIDTSKVDLKTIDFRPTIACRDTVWDNQYLDNNSIINPVKSVIRTILGAGLTSFFRNIITRRGENYWDDDTSSNIYLRYFNDESHKVECLTPVFIPSIDWRIPVNFHFNRVIEYFLPERYCYLPKKKHTYTDKGFLDKKTQYIVWEEFLWQGHAFGFHVRGHPNRVERNKIKEVEVIKKNLEYLLKTKLMLTTI